MRNIAFALIALILFSFIPLNAYSQESITETALQPISIIEPVVVRFNPLIKAAITPEKYEARVNEQATFVVTVADLHVEGIIQDISYLKYDYNNDLKLDDNDVQYLADVTLEKSKCPAERVCDLNKDGSVNVLDVTLLTNIVLKVKEGTIGTASKYLYKISTFHSDGLIVDHQSEISLISGSQEKFKVTVTGKQEGIFKFGIKIEQYDDPSNSARVSAILAIGKPGEPPKPEPVPEPERSMFNGDGFIINSQQNNAEIIKLHLLKGKEGALNVIGKAAIGLAQFRVRGTLEGEKLTLYFYDIERNIKEIDDTGTSTRDTGTSTRTRVADLTVIEPQALFKGNFKNFGSVSVIQGDLSFKSSIWSLTAFDKQGRATTEEIKEILPTKKAPVYIENIKLQEIVPIIGVDEKAITAREELKEISIQPIRVYKPTIIGIPIPFTREIVEARVVSNDGVETIRLREEETMVIGEYKIIVHNLEKEQVDIELIKE